MVRKVVTPVLVILLDHGRIGAVSSAGQNDTLGGIDGDGSAVGLLSLYTGDLAIGNDEFGAGSFGIDLHVQLFSGFPQRIDQGNAVGVGVGPGPHGPQNGGQLAAGVGRGGDAQRTGPVIGVQSVLGQGPGQLDIGADPPAVRHLAQTASIDVPHMQSDGVKTGHIYAGGFAGVGGIEGVDIALQLGEDFLPLGELVQMKSLILGGQGQITVQCVFLGAGEDLTGLGFGVHGVEGAAGHHGVAAQEGAFLDQNDFCTLLRSGDGSAEAGSAAAHDQNIGVPGLSLAGLGVVFTGQGKAGSLGRFGSGSHDGVGAEGSSGDGIQNGGLMLHDLFGNALYGHIGQTGGFMALGDGGGGDLPLGHGEFHGHRSLHTGRGAGKSAGDAGIVGLRAVLGLAGAAGHAQKHCQCQPRADNGLFHCRFLLLLFWSSKRINLTPTYKSRGFCEKIIYQWSSQG